MQAATRFVVTAWRDRDELLAVRREIFGEDLVGRERAVNKILTWRIRKHDLPLLLESTADIVDAVVQDERNQLTHHALRLVYATAISRYLRQRKPHLTPSRFITGLADTQADLSRLKPSFFPPQKTLQFPLALRETRHRIVHRHLPSLAELKRAAKESLDWLWEWYWSHLDAAFADAGRDGDGAGVLSEKEVKENLQGILKAYVKARKTEIKTRKKESKAADNARASYSHLSASMGVKQEVLLQLLVTEKAILPADKKFGASMSGAFLIWSPFLLALSTSISAFLHSMLDRMISIMSAPATRGTAELEEDPVREAMHDWVVHIVSSVEWELGRREKATQSVRSAYKDLLDRVLGKAFLTPTFWTLKLAESLLEKEEAPARESWIKILEAAKDDGNMEIDGEDAVAFPLGAQEMDVETAETVLPILAQKTSKATSKLRGPQKKIGLWKPQPIGMIPKGWEVDE
ncbi:Las1-domain-containing protein [Massarina eburnea CBS 473.64]|uniref:Las1-domain-containing protein n=1 Tax=Massarina eburnea CBS 473.64 TaxID=1395130 RepID=A0A6A6SHM3_9PLEO|nr:Las1-domain-containing protein [Massarina eburnea CBS 473.64]